MSLSLNSAANFDYCTGCSKLEKCPIISTLAKLYVAGKAPREEDSRRLKLESQNLTSLGRYITMHLGHSKEVEQFDRATCDVSRIQTRCVRLHSENNPRTEEFTTRLFDAVIDYIEASPVAEQISAIGNVTVTV